MLNENWTRAPSIMSSQRSACPDFLVCFLASLNLRMGTLGGILWCSLQITRIRKMQKVRSYFLERRCTKHAKKTSQNRVRFSQL